MCFVLRHPGSQEQAGIAAAVSLGAATLLGGRVLPALRGYPANTTSNFNIDPVR